jgi:hypothetical protein
MKITLRSIVFFALSVLLISCGKQEWIEGDFPAAGFSASFPAPMISDPPGKTFRAWGHAGDTLLVVTRVELEANQVPDAGQEDAFFDEMAKDIPTGARFTSPPRTTSFEGKPSMEYTALGPTSDGKVRMNRMRITVVGKFIYVASAQWEPDDKSDPVSADRFHASFHLK